jgi:hypothetical protein
VEAALCRLPCWTQPLPTLAEWQLPSLTMIKSPNDAAHAAIGLMHSPAHIARKQALREHDWKTLFLTKILPLLK